MKNTKNIQRVLDTIEANPTGWDQNFWHQEFPECNTTHCFAGWAQVLAGKPMCHTPIVVRQDARVFFGFTREEADYYFHSDRTLEDLKRSLLDFYDETGFNPNGYDRNGFDRNGFDRMGYNSAGFNEFGYDKYGYNKDGYNSYGYDVDGYDRDGFTEHGFDRDKYDRDGFDIDDLDKNNNARVDN